MKKKTLFAVICFVISLGGFLFGFDTAVISGTLLFIVKQFNLNAVYEGWFVSSALLGCILGAGIAGALSDFFGRRKTLLFSAILLATTAIGCMLSKTSDGLIFYRLIGGLGIGIASIASPMYLSEISPPSIRGTVVSLYQMAITIGIVTIYISNYYLLNISLNSEVSFNHGFMDYIFKQEVWRSMFGVGIIPAFLFLLMLLKIPESPRWLVKKGLLEKARDVLLKTRSQHATENELREITLSLKEGENLKPYGTFWTFVILSIPAVYVGIKVVPETKNKSLEELEKYWLRNE